MAIVDFRLLISGAGCEGLPINNRQLEITGWQFQIRLGHGHGCSQAERIASADMTALL